MELEFSKAKSILSTISSHFEHNYTSPIFSQLIGFDMFVLIELSRQWRTLMYFLSDMGRGAVSSEFKDEGTHRDLDISYERYWRGQEFENKITTSVAFKPCTVCEHRLKAKSRILTPLTADVIVNLIESSEIEGYLWSPFPMLPYIP
jgi:hypothetical protein